MPGIDMISGASLFSIRPGMATMRASGASTSVVPAAQLVSSSAGAHRATDAHRTADPIDDGTYSPATGRAGASGTSSEANWQASSVLYASDTPRAYGGWQSFTDRIFDGSLRLDDPQRAAEKVTELYKQF